MKQITVLFFFMLGLGLNLRSDVAESFSPLSNNNFGRQQSIKETSFNQLISKTFVQSQTSLQATNDKRRRRKTPPTVPPKDPVKTSQENIEGLSKKSINFIQDDVDDDDDNNDEQSKKIDLQLMNEIAKFEFQKDKEITMGIKDAEITSTDSDQPLAIPLPDISEVKKRKQIEEELKRYEEEKEDQKVRIKRTDKEAFRRLLEQQPFADADDSLFEEEAYGTVAALLGERAKPFLSIPFGPLQVGHFIGSLGIMLMAFVEYPGFPLTNLPTPLRECLQGGLLSVYAINLLLAVASIFKAKERGQPLPLWIIKTLAVGGLAYDQLTQLPTLEEIEKAKSVKGKRALKNKQLQR